MKEGGAVILILAVVSIFGVIIFAGLQAGYISNRALLLDGSNSMQADLDMDDNYVLYFEQRDWIHTAMAPGATDVSINAIPAGSHTQDEHHSMLMVSLDVAPGADKNVNVSISDGTSTMIVTISGAVDVFGQTTTNAFDLDVSAEIFTLKYSQTAGGLTDHACIMMHWWYKVNE